MKKSLLALAVLGAFVGAASAQSSVTVFGMVDLSANYIDNGGTKSYYLASNQLNSNRLGFRGIEDLGGGLQAGFHLEAGMNNASGLAGGGGTGAGCGDNVTNCDGNDATNAGQLFNRRSTVSLIGKWGEVRLGRDYVPTFWQGASFDVDGANGLGTYLNLISTLGSGAKTFVRANNSAAYFLPSGLGGVYGSIMASAGQGAPGWRYRGGRIGYAAGPFDAAVGYSETQTATSDNFKVTNFGVSWDFKVVKAYLTFNQNKWGSLKQDLWGISAGMPIGAAELRAAYVHSDLKGSPAIDPNDAKMWTIEGVYNLSKRTALYATYAQISNDGASAVTVLPGSSTATLAGKSSKGYNVGIRHSF